MNTIIVKNAARLLHGKSAILNPIMGADNALYLGKWIHPNNLEARVPVTAVRHLAGRHQSNVGEIVQVEDLDGTAQGHVQYLEIFKVMSGDLTGRDLTDIGYESMEAFQAAENLGTLRPMWLIRVQHVPKPDQGQKPL